MENSKEIKIKLAVREWKRQFYTAVVRSFAKTVAEPITNSDTSYKRKYDLPDASGLVEKALTFERGMRFDLSRAKEELFGKSPERIIELHIYTAKGHGRKPRTCELVDFAEGLSQEKIKNAFEWLAADKSDVSKGRPGRSLFGRGVSDVLLGHKAGMFFSYHGDILSKSEFLFNPDKDKEPKISLGSKKNPSIADLKDCRLLREETGSCVRFILHDDCRIPEEGTLIPILSQFYMLRLINSDPNVKIKVFRYRSSGKTLEDILDYDFPIGNVIEKFSFSISCPTIGASFQNLKVDAIVCRAEDRVGLPGKEAGEQRANGLLVVDDKDAVLDLTFLPQFEGAPYLNCIYGIIRITNIRSVFEWYLNSGKDSPLTVTRDGFDQKHEFTKLLFKELEKRLEPIFKREEERYKKSLASNISSKTQERINEALKELNKFLKDIGEGEGGAPESSSTPLPTKKFQFIPEETKLVIGREKSIRLYLEKDLAESKTSIIYDSSNSKIEVNPLSHLKEDGKTLDNYLVYLISIKCDTLHENGEITALTESKEGLLEAHLKVSDVTHGYPLALLKIWNLDQKNPGVSRVGKIVYLYF